MAKTVALAGTVQMVLQEVEPGPLAFITLSLGAYTVTAMGEDMAYTLPVDKQIKVKVSYVDSQGNPAAVDGGVTWASSNATIARVDFATDAAASFEAVVVPVGPVGQVQITANADADLGAGTRALVTTMDVTVVAGEAVAGVIEPVGAPDDIPHVDPRA